MDGHHPHLTWSWANNFPPQGSLSTDCTSSTGQRSFLCSYPPATVVLVVLIRSKKGFQLNEPNGPLHYLESFEDEVGILLAPQIGPE